MSKAIMILVTALALAADIEPPKLPERDKLPLVTASSVALDVAKVVSYLEQGQAYHKAYAKGTHSASENKAFVRFAEDYDRELGVLKQELDVLRVWLEKKSDLKPE